MSRRSSRHRSSSARSHVAHLDDVLDAHRAVQADGTPLVAIRAGEVSAIAPLRYVRLVFALLIAVVLLGERPDAPTLIGAGLIVAAGLYALWRERLRALASAPALR